MTSRRPNKLAGFWLKVTIPVLIGIVAVIWMFQREYVPGTWESVRFTWRAVIGIALAWCLMAGRDLGLTWRFRAITDRK
ncbi:MAG: hypothetical protein K2M76_00360, partial [Muribaculaceae bacterium]|nr:hypothetical protein [Muribaculaceae bacterium]